LGRPRPLASALVVGVLTALACHAMDALPEARQVMERYFAARAAGDSETLLALHHPVFFEDQPPERWTETLAAVDTRLGLPGGHTLQRRKLVSGIKQAGVGSYVLLTYSVRHARAETLESFILFKPAAGGDVRIVSHQLEATRFLESEEGLQQEGSP